VAGTARDTALKKIKRLERNAICNVENADPVWIVGMPVPSTISRVTARSLIVKIAKAIAAGIADAANASAPKLTLRGEGDRMPQCQLWHQVLECNIARYRLGGQ